MKTPKFGGLGAIGLAMALVAAMMLPTAAMAQGKKDKAAAAPAGVPEAARKLGMAKAPGVATAMNLPCQVSDARQVGEDKKTKTFYYEVACATGTMGYILSAPEAGAPSAFSCIEANTPPAPGQPPAAPCMLPGNANPNALLQIALTKAATPCNLLATRQIGQTNDATYVEASCEGDVGYIVKTTRPMDLAQPIKADNCLIYDAANGNLKCALAEPAARLAVVDKYVTAGKVTCGVKNRRYVGQMKDGTTAFEASCDDGKGYVLKVDDKGAVTAMECVKAPGLCELTDSRQALTEQAALYTRLVKGAGGNCDVERYALFPSKAGEEVVELVCKGDTGAIAMFKAGSKGQVLDCGHAPIAGYKCSLGKDPGFKFLTADLKKFKSDTTCDVSASRLVGKTDKGVTLMEVACSDKFKGYIVEYQTEPAVTAINVTGCALAGNCKLPGNI